jgi:hypothetical protein
MPLGINVRRKGIEVSEKGHREPDFVIGRIVPGSIRRELPAPGEHSRITNSAARDPEELVVGFLRRMQCELRRAGIKIHIHFIFGGGVWSAVAAGATIFEKLHAGHQIFFGGRYRIQDLGCLTRCGRIDGHVRECRFESRGRSVRVDGKQTERRDYHERERQHQYSNDESEDKFLHDVLRKMVWAIRRTAYLNVSRGGCGKSSNPITLTTCPLGGCR